MSVARLPTMKIDAETFDSFAAHVMSGVDEAEKCFGFDPSKERRIDEFGDPIHFVGIR